MRLPRLTPDELEPEQRALYDAIVGGPRSAGPQLFELADGDGRLNGPFGVMLHSPAVGGALQELGAAIRYRSVLGERLREIAVLAVAAHWSSDFEQYAHEPLGRRAGLTDEQLDALAAGAEVALDDPADVAGLRLVRALLRAGDLSDEEYAEGHRVLGEQALVELTTLVGYYATLALQLRVFRVGVPGR
ncbi:MAG TPA: carboxymuconolactone decarboxylase family protein [Blastococcus sp.]|jgi:4-carboxymuconolactone decarboxylase|nr:carboxymuconolactone decarboxylase family protein [Blastococcus sp.]